MWVMSTILDSSVCSCVIQYQSSIFWRPVKIPQKSCVSSKYARNPCYCLGLIHFFFLPGSWPSALFYGICFPDQLLLSTLMLSEAQAWIIPLVLFSSIYLGQLMAHDRNTSICWMCERIYRIYERLDILFNIFFQDILKFFLNWFSFSKYTYYVYIYIIYLSKAHIKY